MPSLYGPTGKFGSTYRPDASVSVECTVCFSVSVIRTAARGIGLPDGSDTVPLISAMATACARAAFGVIDRHNINADTPVITFFGACIVAPPQRSISLNPREK